MKKVATGLASLLVVLIVLTGLALQASWCATDRANEVDKKYEVHSASQQVDRNWEMQTLKEIRDDLKDIKRKLESRGMFK